jgi:phospholipase C
MRSFLSIATSVTLLLSMLIDPSGIGATTPPTPPPATTPIQHVVVIFGENISFDHYFATYPKALNPPGQPRFTALPGTPSVNGLTQALLTSNPNNNPAKNGTDAANPFRLNRTQALTPSQGHSYTPEESSFDQGAMDMFPKNTGAAGTMTNMTVLSPAAVTTKGLVMGYYDGNTVTAMWNYAQSFAMSDNSYNSNFGPSTPGAINLISGQTNGISASTNGPSSNQVADGTGGFTMIGDAEALGDLCSNASKFNAAMSGKNIGDLLNTANLTWGWFQGGFDLSLINANGSMGCNRSTTSPITGVNAADYVDHHQPFQYYASTANLTHARPTSPATVGSQDAANHQYDMHDFFDALAVGNLPAVSFLKAPAYQDAHPGNSDPLDEQAFVVNIVNTLEQSPFWNSTAIIVAYDDSDGWYDHQQGTIINGSFASTASAGSNVDTLTGLGACGTQGVTPQLPGPNSGVAPVNGRCAPGVRTPLLVISPWAKANFVDHTFTIQTSIMRFIEDNWTLGQVGGGSFDAIANPINNMFNFVPTTPPNTNKPNLSTVTGLPQ